MWQGGSPRHPVRLTRDDTLELRELYLPEEALESCMVREFIRLDFIGFPRTSTTLILSQGISVFAPPQAPFPVAVAP